MYCFGCKVNAEISLCTLFTILNTTPTSDLHLHFELFKLLWSLCCLKLILHSHILNIHWKRFLWYMQITDTLPQGNYSTSLAFSVLSCAAGKCAALLKTRTWDICAKYLHYTSFYCVILGGNHPGTEFHLIVISKLRIIHIMCFSVGEKANCIPWYDKKKRAVQCENLKNFQSFLAHHTKTFDDPLLHKTVTWGPHVIYSHYKGRLWP